MQEERRKQKVVGDEQRVEIVSLKQTITSLKKSLEEEREAKAQGELCSRLLQPRAAGRPRRSFLDSPKLKACTAAVKEIESAQRLAAGSAGGLVAN